MLELHLTQTFAIQHEIISQTFYFWFIVTLDLLHVIVQLRVSFYNQLSVTDNFILSGLFWSYMHDYFNIANCLKSVFKPVSAGKMGVYELIDQYVNS